MLIYLPIPVIVLLDIVGWLIIHLGVAYGMTQLPERCFAPTAWIFQWRRWEGDGAIYHTLFRIKTWKNFLPDGAALFRKGFQKKHLLKNDQAYFERFVTETCRGELTHWLVFCCAPIFFIWNYWWVGIIMIIYACAANFPCILTQRYNRIRFFQIINHHQRVQSSNSEQ
jgi:glycosyl-4,4'-diaponeurosporenoate acyltransferase